MDLAGLLQNLSFLWSPVAFAACAGVAITLVWLAFSPARPKGEVRQRLDGYLETDVVEEAALGQSVWRRVVLPAVRWMLHAAGRLAPKGNIEKLQQSLVQAGQPGGMNALDFIGLRLLLVVLAAGGYFILFGRNLSLLITVRNLLVIGLVVYFLPSLWLR